MAKKQNTNRRVVFAALIFGVLGIVLTLLVSAADEFIAFDAQADDTTLIKTDENASEGTFVEFTGEQDPGGDREDVPADQIIEAIPGLPTNSQIKQAWQLDFNCYKDSSRNYFTPTEGIHTEINLGFGTAWMDMRVRPTIGNGNQFDEAFALDNLTINNIVNSDGDETDVSFRVEGRSGCYARFNEAPATPETKGSLFHDYLFFDLASGILGIGNPIQANIENLDNGTYSVLLITSDWSSDRRWITSGDVTGNVPHAPRSGSITQGSLLSPEFTVDDGAINMQWGAVAGNTHDASVAGLIIIQHD